MEEPFTVALAIPLRGPGGIFGPSCELVTSLAVERVNAEGGIAGREVRLHVVDAGAPPAEVGAEVRALARNGHIHAVTGWHISSVRQALAPSLPDAVPYVYTSLHEGGPDLGALLVGENPADQVIPALGWLKREVGISRWALVGSDYVWPHGTAVAVRAYASAAGLTLVREDFVPYGWRDFRPVIDRIRRSSAEGVLMLLVGRDAVLFNRQFAAVGLTDRIARFTPLMEENMLMASGEEATRNLFVAAAYFASLHTEPALDFVGAYSNRFGQHAPTLNNAAESCYEGILALVAAAQAARSTDGRRIRGLASDGFTYEGPRGPVQVDSRGSRQAVYIAEANGYEFDVLSGLSPTPA